MKRVYFVVMILLGLGIFCSCQKTPQDYSFVGTWEVSSKRTNSFGSPETTVKKPVAYFQFEEWGEGKIIPLETSTELQEMDDWFFTYVYDKEKQTIEFESWTNKVKSLWIVDKLTDVSFTCHAPFTGGDTIFTGKKLK